MKQTRCEPCGIVYLAGARTCLKCGVATTPIEDEVKTPPGAALPSGADHLAPTAKPKARKPTGGRK